MSPEYVRDVGSLLLLGFVACGGAADAGAARPESALAQTRSAQGAFRALERAFEDPALEQKQNLRASFEQFLEDYPSDPRTRTVRIYLARLYVRSAQWIVAESLLKPLLLGPMGTERDLAMVVQAELELGQRRPDQAERLLRGLERKLVDSESRSYYGEISARTAIALEDWPLAVRSLETWLLDSSNERLELDQERASALIWKLPPETIEQALRGLDRSTTIHSSISGARAWLRNELSERLVEHALSTKDVALARRLLELDRSSRAALGNPKLSRLAEASSGVARILGGSVGIVTSLGSATTRRRSMAALAGLSAARAEAIAPRTKVRAQSSTAGAPLGLLVRDDGGSAANVAAALGLLASDGASLLVAGVDAETSLAARAFAATSEIPVLLLDDPNFEALPVSAFVLGANENAARDFLISQLPSSGWAPFAAVEASSDWCHNVMGKELMHPDAAHKTQEEGLPALLLFAGPECCRGVIDRHRKLGFGFVLGLDASELFRLEETPEGPRAAAASSAGARASQAKLAALTSGTFLTRGGPARSWFHALGRDAWLLAEQALAGFPSDSLIEGAAAVSRWHQRARRQLARATVPLVTANVQGFTDGRRVARRFQVVFSDREPHEAVEDRRTPH